MKVKTAIIKRLMEICDKRHIKPNELATRSGVTPSTVYTLLSRKSNGMSVVTLKKLIDGLDLTLPEFFDAEIFRTLEQEIE